MPATLNVSLTDELRAFVDANCGDGTPYVTPSEFLRSLIREKKLRREVMEWRTDILQGFQDIANGRFIEFNGNLEETLATYNKTKKSS